MPVNVNPPTVIAHDLPPSSEVVVIGGGVMGTSSAYALARRGVQVTVVERDGIATGASGRNAGIFSPSSIYTSGLTPLLSASARIFRRWPEELEADFAFRPSGTLMLSTDPDAPATLRSEYEQQGASETPAQILDGDEARRLVPALAPIVTGAVYYPGHGHIWPFALNHALAAAAARRGARIVQGTEVTGIDLDGSGRISAVQTTRGRVACRWIVNAANAWAAPVARMVGLEMPVEPQRGQILAALPAPAFLPMPLDYVTGGSPLYWRQTPAGNVVMGGGRTFDRAGMGSYDRRNTLEIVRFFASRIAALTPGAKDLTVVRMWGGTMGFTPDYRPIIGPTAAVPGFVMAQACNGSGMGWSAIVGRLVADCITGVPPSVPLDLVTPDRFLDGQEKG